MSARERPPVAWRLLLALAAIKVVIHLLASGPLAWGYMTDELYFLDSTDHLQWGYVDHPPLSIALLALIRALLGDSIFAVRLLPTFLGAATVLGTGLLARELGGGRGAQGLAALATLSAPVFLAMAMYYSMNPIEHLLWTAGMLVVARIINGGDARLWVILGAVMGLGVLNKVSMVWFGAGLGLGLVLTPQRRWLLTPWPWIAAAITAGCSLPFVVWQMHNGWPFLEFSRNAAAIKVGAVSPLSFIGQQLLGLNVMAAPLWIAGLAFLFLSAEGRPYQPLAWIYVTTFLLLMSTGSARAHYLAPAYPILFAAGAVAFQQQRRWPQLTARTAWAIAISGVIGAPAAMAILPPDATVRYVNALGLQPPQELERGGALPMHLGLFFHAEAVLRPITAVYDSLTEDERKRVEILTASFGETGAVNVIGRKRGLPHAIGRHNQYGLWGPGAATGELMIVVHGTEGNLDEWFERCERRAEIDCPYCMEMMQAQAVYLCHHVRRPLREIWPEMKIYR